MGQQIDHLVSSQLQDFHRLQHAHHFVIDFIPLPKIDNIQEKSYGNNFVKSSIIKFLILNAPKCSDAI